jgi:hypothetical protein
MVQDPAGTGVRRPYIKPFVTNLDVPKTKGKESPLAEEYTGATYTHGHPFSYGPS